MDDDDSAGYPSLPESDAEDQEESGAERSCEGGGIRCVICMDAAEEGDGESCPEHPGPDPSHLIPLACGHTFHASCAVRWLQTGRSDCPLCRHDPASRRRSRRIAQEEEEGDDGYSTEEEAEEAEEEERRQRLWERIRQFRSSIVREGQVLFAKGEGPSRHRRAIREQTTKASEHRRRLCELRREKSALTRSEAFKEAQALRKRSHALRRQISTTHRAIHAAKKRAKKWMSRLGDRGRLRFQLEGSERRVSWEAIERMRRRNEVSDRSIVLVDGDSLPPSELGFYASVLSRIVF